MNRRRPTSEQRKQVFDRDGNQCVFCGTNDPLELAAISPFSSRGDVGVDDFITLCPNCHSRFDSGSVRGFEFESFIESLLKSSPGFSDVRREAKHPQSNLTFDITAKDRGDDLVVECRSDFGFVRSRLNELLKRLDDYASKTPNHRFILATLGELTDEQRHLVEAHGHEHWGPKYIAEHYAEQLRGLRGNFIADLINFTAGNRTHVSELGQLRQRLIDCIPGRPDWSTYQHLIGNLVETLFVPPLEKTIIECSDEYKVNRRDFVLPNYCTDGFWQFLRDQYSADYIVIDAKNYTGEIKKKEILQIANYLKKHGTGLLGLIFTRVGTSSSARVTIREQWAIYGKLIVVLNDDDVLSMLSASSSGGNPDTIIRQRIEEFRLKM
jgi:hypothetical protein